jgi:hypothetical protein
MSLSPLRSAPQKRWRTIVHVMLSIVFGNILLVHSVYATSSVVKQQVAQLNTTQKEQPTQAEKEQINTDIDVMLSAMSSGDVAVFIEKTHPALFPLLGGKENFTEFLTEAMAQIDNLGIKILSNEFEEPGRYYKAGKELLSIVPRISIMEIEGKKAKTIGFMIAIKDTTTNTWKYLDGSGLREDKSMLWQMFPELETDIKFPENRVEMIE